MNFNPGMADELEIPMKQSRDAIRDARCALNTNIREVTRCQSGKSMSLRIKYPYMSHPINGKATFCRKLFRRYGGSDLKQKSLGF